jgi:predicted nucleic acid-binding protein
MSFLLDTNVVSEAEQKFPSKKVLNWLLSKPETSMYISAVSFGEIRKGIERLPSSAKKAHLQDWLDELRMRFAGRILPFSEESGLVWGKMMGSFEAKGIVRSPYDSLIEAIALEHDLILVTRNVRNFQGSSVTIFNPWEE